MINKTIIVLLFFFFSLFLSCGKEEKTPLYVGKWAFSEAVPAENVDECYHATWFWIFEDNSFSIYDSCEDEITDGEWMYKGFEIQVIVNGELYDKFEGRMLSLDNNYMVIETEMFDGTTKIRFRKIHDAER